MDVTETQSFFIFINEISIELRMEETSVLIIVAVMLCYLSSSERKGRKLRSERDSIPDLCGAEKNDTFKISFKFTRYNQGQNKTKTDIQF